MAEGFHGSVNRPFLALFWSEASTGEEVYHRHQPKELVHRQFWGGLRTVTTAGPISSSRGVEQFLNPFMTVPGSFMDSTVPFFCFRHPPVAHWTEPTGDQTTDEGATRARRGATRAVPRSRPRNWRPSCCSSSDRTSPAVGKLLFFLVFFVSVRWSPKPVRTPALLAHTVSVSLFCLHTKHHTLVSHFRHSRLFQLLVPPLLAASPVRPFGWEVSGAMMSGWR